MAIGDENDFRPQNYEKEKLYVPVVILYMNGRLI